jgi:hypothetical protein
MTGTSATFSDAVIQALVRAGQYSRDDQVPPIAVLWPDGERRWQPLLPALRGRTQSRGRARPGLRRQRRRAGD